MLLFWVLMMFHQEAWFFNGVLFHPETMISFLFGEEQLTDWDIVKSNLSDFSRDKWSSPRSYV